MQKKSRRPVTTTGDVQVFPPRVFLFRRWDAIRRVPCVMSGASLRRRTNYEVRDLRGYEKN